MDTDHGIGALLETARDEPMANSGLSFFEPLRMDNSIADFKEYESRPLSGESSGPFQFNIAPEDGLFLDPSSLRLRGELKVQKLNANGALINLESADAGKVSVVNLFPASLFKNLTMQFNNRDVSFTASPQNALKAYIETITSYGKEAMKTHLYANRFLQDQPGQSQGDAAFSLAGNGVKMRSEWIADSKWVDFDSTLHLDVLNVKDLIPDKLPITLKMDRNPDSYTLLTHSTMDGTEYRIVLKDLKLHYRKVIPSQEQRNAVKAKFDRDGVMQYEITRNIIYTHAVPKGADQFTHGNIVVGSLPYFVLIGLQDSRATAGHKHYDPFHFKHFNLRECKLIYQAQSLPTFEMKTNFGAEVNESTFMARYRHTFDNLGIRHSRDSNSLTPERYLKDFPVMAWDLSPDQCFNWHNHKDQIGALEARFDFGTATPENMQIVYYLTFRDYLTIDKYRNVQIKSGTSSAA